MIIIRIKGGLGNQMFQYAFGRALALRRGTELLLDTSLSATPGIKRDIAREYKLGHFNIKAEIASEKDVRRLRHGGVLFLKKIKRKISGFNYYAFDEGSFNAKDNTYFEGLWWQSERYFSEVSDIIREDFILKNELSPAAKLIENEIVMVNSVAIHIRRGDYIKDKETKNYHGSLPLSYYEEALGIIKSEVKEPYFFVFSDDIEWAKENLSTEKPIIFVSSPDINDFEELVLMSKCKHQIIANSTFSWWAAWLNRHPQKVIIAPKRWVNNPKINTDDVIPSTWRQI